MAEDKIESSVPDPKVLANQDKSVRGLEQAPTSRDASPSDVDWKRMRSALGAPYDPSSIPLRRYTDMSLDTMLAFGLHVKKVAQARAQYHFEARDASGVNAQIAAHADSDWREIHARFVLQRSTNLNYGFAGQAKRFILKQPGGVYIDENGAEQPIWSEGAVLPIAWKTPSVMNPLLITPIFDDNTGEFNGILLDISGNASKAKKTGGRSASDTEQTIDIYHAYWSTNNKDAAFGSMYGQSALQPAFRYWWSYWWRWAQYDRAFERLAIPPIVAYHPDGSFSDPEDPSISTPYQEIALVAAENLRSNAIAAVPSSVVSGGLEEKGINLRQWSFEYLETNTDPFDKFQESFNYLDTMKFRSLMISEEAFFGGKGASASRNTSGQQTENFNSQEEGYWLEMAADINKYWLPQWLQLNYPEFVANGGVVKIIGNGFQAVDTELQKQVIQLLGQQDPSQFGVDAKELANRIGLPMLSLAAIQAQQAEIASKATQPPAVNGGRTGLSVVPVSETGASNGGSTPEPTAVGFSDDPTQRMVYVQPGEYIVLSDAEDFLASLPKTSAYDDKTMKALASQLRKTWLPHYEDIYQSYADELETVKELQFADDTDKGVSKAAAKKAANSLIKRWKLNEEKFEDVQERTRTIMKKMAKRAVRLAQQKSNIKVKINEDDYDSFVEGQLAKLMQRTTKTAKQELFEFTAKRVYGGQDPTEIAAEVRDHFSDFPNTHANRVARSETRTVSNGAKIIMAEAGEYKYMKASDGEDFDEDCRERNGKVLTTKEAREANDKTHSFCTLDLDIVPDTELAVEFSDRMPKEYRGKKAIYDETTKRVIMLSDISDAEARLFMGEVADGIIKEHA